MAGGTLTAAGGRAPDFVPLWVQALIVIAGFAALAVAACRRRRR